MNRVHFHEHCREYYFRESLRTGWGCRRVLNEDGRRCNLIIRRSGLESRIWLWLWKKISIWAKPRCLSRFPPGPRPSLILRIIGAYLDQISVKNGTTVVCCGVVHSFIATANDSCVGKSNWCRTYSWCPHRTV